MPTVNGSSATTGAGCDHALRLPLSFIERLEENRTTCYPKGTVLCAQGASPEGVYILCDGRVKVYTSAGDGRTLVVGSMGAGELVGVSAVISGEPYPVTVETTEYSRVTFIPSEVFLRRMQQDIEVAIKAAQQLTKNCLRAVDEIRALGFSQTVPQKLARLLVQWMDSPALCRENAGGGLQITVSSTQEEIAQMIGSTRETVSRSLSGFRRTKLLRVNGATWTVLDPRSLRELVDQRQLP
jgi:CRP/FNR family transcriptional regulator, cyclic AMP receptor protein